jgi:hypothetical protein
MMQGQYFYGYTHDPAVAARALLAAVILLAVEDAIHGDRGAYEWLATDGAPQGPSVATLARYAGDGRRQHRQE